MSGNVADPRLFDYDPLSGLTEYFHYDPETDGFSIETRQDMQPLIDVSKAMFNDAPLRWGDMTHVKHIPAVIAMELAKQGIMSAGYQILDHDRFKKFLNERDTAAFRTRPGVI
jgi:hypothetical protein